MDKKYNVIYADPPWRFGSKYVTGNGVEHKLEEKYPTMGDKEIIALGPQIQKLTTKNAVLFMWTTNAHLKVALEALEAWGFTYRTIAFVWVKMSKTQRVRVNMGMWTMPGCEICLLATKGAPHKFLKARNVKQVLLAPRTIHSRKPQEIRDRIVEMFGEKAKYLELFAREKVYPFDVFGNEVESDVTIST